MSYLDREGGHRDRTNPVISVTDGDTKLMFWPESPERNELFHLGSDPGEKENRFDSNDPETQRMLELARKQKQDATSPWGAEPEL